MTRRAAKPPDWPKSLTLAEPSRPVLTVQGGGMPMVTLDEALQPRTPAPILAIALGTLRDGRHAAMVLQVSGRDVTSATLLEAGPEVAAAAQSCHEAAFLRLWLRKDFAAYEAAEHTPLEPATIRDAVAVALPAWKGKVGAVAFDVEGRTVTEPRVLATGDRLFAWDVLEAWMSINLLPRYRR